MNVYNFENVTDFDYHWIVGDSIRTIKRDIYFSLGTRYYCDAGCHVCYIIENLKTIKKNVASYFPPITDAHQALWEDVFSYYEYLRTDDDMLYLKLNQPRHYQWFKENGHRFEYGMTDNAIFRYNKVAKEINFKGVGSVSISSHLAERVTEKKMYDALNNIHDTSPIQQVKLIDTGNVDILKQYADWANKLNIEVLFHYDFNKKRNLIDKDWVEDQVTWIDTDQDGTMQVYGDEAIGLYFDSFYLSNETSSDIAIEPYHRLQHKFDPEKFLVDLAKGKQKLYSDWMDRTRNKKFSDYFRNTQKYEFHENFNFMPSSMMPPYSKYCAKMMEQGWQRTKHGFFKNDGQPIKSIVTKKL
jgi:hypothetical protein